MMITMNTDSNESKEHWMSIEPLIDSVIYRSEELKLSQTFLKFALKTKFNFEPNNRTELWLIKFDLSSLKFSIIIIIIKAFYYELWIISLKELNFIFSFDMPISVCKLINMQIKYCNELSKQVKGMN